MYHFKQEALFWHLQWRATVNVMRRVTIPRQQRSLRHIMRDDGRIRTSKMAEAISKNRNSN